MHCGMHERMWAPSNSSGRGQVAYMNTTTMKLVENGREISLVYQQWIKQRLLNETLNKHVDLTRFGKVNIESFLSLCVHRLACIYTVDPSLVSLFDADLLHENKAIGQFPIKLHQNFNVCVKSAAILKSISWIFNIIHFLHQRKRYEWNTKSWRVQWKWGISPFL